MGCGSLLALCLSSPGLTGRSSNHRPTRVTGLPVKPGNDTDRVNSHVKALTLAPMGATIVVALLAKAARKPGDHKGRPYNRQCYRAPSRHDLRRSLNPFRLVVATSRQSPDQVQGGR